VRSILKLIPKPVLVPLKLFLAASVHRQFFPLQITGWQLLNWLSGKCDSGLARVILHRMMRGQAASVLRQFFPLQLTGLQLLNGLTVQARLAV
jgi:hypothetical protein